IPNLRIGGPHATKGRTGQLGWHAGTEKGADIALGGDGFDRREVLPVASRLRLALVPAPEWPPAPRPRDAPPPRAPPPPGPASRAFGRRLGRGGGLCCLGLLRRFTLAPRPARNEVFRLAHSRSFCGGVRRASASGSARSRSRL